MTNARVQGGELRLKTAASRPAVGALSAALSIVGAVACVGGGGGGALSPDSGVENPQCSECAPGCFDCGTGCQCGLDGGQLPWEAPFDNVGVDGTWRSDTPSFCAGTSALDGVDVWSDERGVFVLTAGSLAVNSQPASIGGDPQGQFETAGCLNGCSGETLFFNDGQAGWRKVAQNLRDNDGTNLRSLHGFPSGPLVLHGGTSAFLRSPGCALGMFDQGVFECFRTSGHVPAFHAVSSTLAYASIENALLLYDGTVWSLIDAPAPETIIALWADQTQVIAFSQDGLLMTFQAGVWTSQATNIPGTHAVWVTSPADLWIGTFGGDLFHVVDGVPTLFNQLTSPCGVSELWGIWGAGDTIYYYGPTELHRIRNGVDEELGSWLCERSNITITSLWGNAPDEVFVATRDFSRRFMDTCGDVFVHYFDGESFHRL